MRLISMLFPHLAPGHEYMLSEKNGQQELLSRISASCITSQTRSQMTNIDHCSCIYESQKQPCSDVDAGLLSYGTFILDDLAY